MSTQISTPSVQTPSGAAIKLAEFNAAVKARYAEVASMFDGAQEVSPLSRPDFITFIKDHLASVNGLYVVSGKFNPLGREVDADPNATKVETLQDAGFVVSGESKKAESGELADNPALAYATDRGLKLDDSDDDLLNSRYESKK